jgi:Concanavalin A-like lectin/glucanases superfamily/IPT/TIG domain
MSAKKSISKGYAMQRPSMLVGMAMALISLLTASLVQATTDSFNGSGNWTAPAGVTSVTVEAWGGGGAGGGATSNPAKGGGGAGGQYARKLITVVPGTSYVITVGAGGAGSAGSGGAGGDSIFSSNVVIAKGGAGGSAATSGIAGVGSAAGGVGDVVFAGGSGSDGAVTGGNCDVGGAGGGGAGSTGAGGNASGNTAGSGTANGGGAGGAGRTSSGNGNTGSQSGGAGGGACAQSATSRTGGGGANGKVNITYASAGPTVITNVASALTSSGATLNGTVTSNGGSTSVTFEFGLTTAYGSTVTAAQSPLAFDAAGSAVSAAVTGLSCNTLYHFRAKGVNSAGTTNGGDRTFTTSACPPPTVTSISPTAGSTAGGTSVTITGTNFTGATGVTIGGAAATSVVVVSATSITAITPARTAGAKDVVVTTPSGSGTGTGLFTYLAPPTVTTNAATALTATGATLNGTVTSNGTATTVTFEYGLTTAYGTTVTATQSPLASNASNAAVSVALTGLSCNTTYHFRAIGDNGTGPITGSDATFTTSFSALLCSTVAIYTLDDQTWNDSSGNGYNGAVGGLGGTAPTFSSVSPAVGTTTGTCGYRSFTRSDKTYIFLPSAFPDMGADGKAFTITAWIRTTDNTQSGQRILIDDENNTGGYGFSLGDGGTGMVRFYTRGAASALILDTGNVIANNTWYFVAAVADVPNKKKYIYVFNTAGGLVTTVNATWTEASFGSDSGVASIGGETNASGENTGSFGFAGNLDEVRVYPNALSQTDLGTVQAITRPCPPNVVTPGAFNACDVTSPKCTPAALPDVSYAALANKSTGQSFNLDAVALLSGGTLKSSFAGNVQVDLLANTSSGVTIGPDNCPVSQTATIALGNKTFAAGRASISNVTVSTAYSDVRVRYTCTAAVCGTAVTACSTDSFAVITSGPDHYELSLPSSSVSCLASTATVTACANNSSPCTSTFAGANGSTATLATTGATLGTTTVTFNAAGVATTTLSYPLAPDGTSVSVTLSGEGQIATNARQCCPDGVSCVAGNSCSTTFKTTGFIFSTSVGGAAATVPTQTAGTTSSQYYLRAVKTNTTTQACVSALTPGSSSVNLGYNCNNPATCSAGLFLDITPYNGAAAQATGAVAAGGTAQNLFFDANGNAPLTFSYRDVGQITLTANKAATGSLLSALSGTSNAFVAKPGGFTVSAVKQTVSPQLANPAAAGAGGSIFVKAGESFTATVTATTSGGVATPNYGHETTPEGVLLTPSLVLPSGGSAGVVANPLIAGGSFSSGVATPGNLAWSEVGILTLTPSVGDGDYLGAGNVTGTASGNIGRFYPDHFTISGAAVTAACTAGTAFSYFGEDGFSTAFTLTAQNLSGGTTTNYTGTFAKLGISTYANFGFTAAALPAGSTLSSSATVPSGSWSNGVAAVTAKHQISRPTALTGQTSITVSAAPTDGEVPAGTASSLGAATLRYGRLQLQNAYGSELLALPVPLRAQYWNGSAWVTNADDSCTTITAPTSGAGLTLHLSTGVTTASVNVSGKLASGDAGLRFTAPGAGNSGYVDISIPLALKPWLQFPWAGGANVDPTGRATFGIFRSPLIYRRENY